MGDLLKSALGLSGRNKRSMQGGTMGLQKPNFGPLKWQNYFDEEQFVKTKSGKHHIYIKGTKGPIILCLHGGGYNGLTWALFAKEIYENIECKIIALDFRGHGNTETINDDDLSLDTLTQDVADIANYLADKENTKIVLIGHSMGGAIAVSASYKIENLSGLCVIDIVEGTALDALSSMQSILRSRPINFKTLPDAIRWCYKGGQCHNLEAARVSMPGQIVNVDTGILACDEWESFDKIDGTSCDVRNSVSRGSAKQMALTEVDEENINENPDNLAEKPPLPNQPLFKHPNICEQRESGDVKMDYKWKIDLSKTETFWQHWFQGLSEKFLSAPVPRILILANISGLDTKLTVGQMQGKFQLQVLAKTGHAVHEDQPHQVAEILSVYLVKQKCANAKNNFSMPLYPNTSC